MISDNSNFVSRHTAILSRLNYVQKKDGKVHYYDLDEFQKALPTFEENPIIYAKRHPALGFKGRSLNDVLGETLGKIVGVSKQAIINNMGSPKLQTVLNITDPETDEKIRRGEIRISPGFWYSAPDVGSLKNISGDHVLLYDSASQIPQGDVAAMIVNQDEENDETAYYGFSEGYLEKAGETMTEKELDTIVEILKNNQDDLTGKILEREKDILVLKQEIETKDAKILKLNQDLEEIVKQVAELEKFVKEEKELKIKNQQDSLWDTFYPGTQAKFADRRSELENNDLSLKLLQDMTTFERTLSKPQLSQAEGSPNLMNNQNLSTEDLETMREIKKVVGR